MRVSHSLVPKKCSLNCSHRKKTIATHFSNFLFSTNTEKKWPNKKKTATKTWKFKYTTKRINVPSTEMLSKKAMHQAQLICCNLRKIVFISNSPSLKSLADFSTENYDYFYIHFFFFLVSLNRYLCRAWEANANDRSWVNVICTLNWLLPWHFFHFFH